MNHRKMTVNITVFHGTVKKIYLQMEINVFLILQHSSKKTHYFFSVPGDHHDGQMQSH